MRNLAVAACGAAFTVVLVALAITAANDKASIAFTNGAAPIGEVLSIPPGRGACEPIPAAADFDAVQLSTVAKRGDQFVRVALRGGGSSLGVGDARLPADTGLAVVEFDRQVTERSLTLCVSNRSDARIGLIGAPGERAPRRNGVVRTGDPTLVFLQQPRSLLARIPDAFEHAALFRPGFLGPWTFWFLAFLVLLVAPLLLAAALKRAVEDDATGTPTDDPRGERWRMFQTEVEPRLSAVPRVHRFAQPPLVGDTTLEAQPVAVCIEPADGDVERTRTSLDRQTRAPATVLECSAADAAAACRAPYVAFVPAGVELAPVALERLGQAVRLAPDAAVFTSDEDVRDGQGRREHPSLRPGPSPDLLLTRDLSGSLVCLDRQRASALDLSASDWRYRAALRLGGPDGAGLAHVPMILCHSVDVRSTNGAVGTAREALRAWGRGGRIEASSHGRRVRRDLPGEPSVEVVVLFRDRPELLRRCARSVLAGTSYENLRVRLVDNGSVAPETAELLRQLDGDPRVTVARDRRPFNFAALNNGAAGASEADFLLFLNNDTELLTPTWLEELLEEAGRADVGAVAPMLLFPDGTVQHAGAALGMHGYAGHPFAGLAPERATPFGAAADGTRNWLAVTAACMLVERSKFEQVGGFDESFVVAGNDVDLCLRLTRWGYRSLCVPHVRLFHDEGRSRGSHIDPGDFKNSDRSYGEFKTVGDPFYNPNLTLERTDCGPRLPGEI